MYAKDGNHKYLNGGTAIVNDLKSKVDNGGVFIYNHIVNIIYISVNNEREIMNKKNKMTTQSVVLVGMFAAILAVLSQISIPMPSGVPVTMQTFAVALTGCVLGWKKGTMASVIYIVLGGVGVPVFSGFAGGLGILFGKTGGFIFGFIFLALLCGLAVVVKNKVLGGILAACGLLICHVLGILQFMLLMKMSFWSSAVLVSVPYLIKDVISIVLAFVVGAILRKSLNAANILTYANTI